jgi:(2Fe-2S) ferredoxin
MSRFEKHIFICENQREKGNPKGCCADKGSKEIIELFKKRIKELGLNQKIRVNRSGCLDACEFGPSIVIYPEQTWYGGLKESDVEEIIQSHIINNKPVFRLLIKDKRFNEIN